MIAVVVAATAVTGLASFLWTRVMAWPMERQRLEAAERVRHLDQVPSGKDYAATQLVMLVVGGLCVAATLWAVVSYLGFVGAPMLWSAVGIANLEKARRLQRPCGQMAILKSNGCKYGLSAREASRSVRALCECAQYRVSRAT